MTTKRRRLLWVGDAAVSSGFARATHYTLDTLRKTFDVSVLGLNYTGDPHPYPYDIYPCWPGRDLFGLGRMKELITTLRPSVVVIQNDPWNFPGYLKQCENLPVPVVGAVAVDGKNCRGDALNGLSAAIFWTKFGEEQARLGGYVGPSAVVPLGVDLSIYYPIARQEARLELRLPEVFAKRGLAEDTYLVGVVGRNQPRKRLDLTLEYFAEWVHSRQIENAALWLHVAPTGEKAYDLQQMAKYYGIEKRVIVPEIEPIHGLPEELMRVVYNAFDCMLTTTQGEGWGLPMQEGMACGVPQIVPNWSALGEWTEDAARKVPCTSHAATPRGINVIGGIADKSETVIALDVMYRNIELRKQCHERGLRVVNRPEYRWENIGTAFCDVVESALYPDDMPMQPVVTFKREEVGV